MRRIRFIVALVLAALWLPVSLHCTIEAASGLETPGCVGVCHDSATTTAEHDDSDHARGHDGCEIVESGRYKAGFTLLKVGPPVAPLCACLLCAPVLELGVSDELPQAAVAARERPRDWVPVWHFVRRAAPAPRAPAAV